MAFFDPALDDKGTAFEEGRAELLVASRKEHCFEACSFVLEGEEFHGFFMRGEHFFGGDEPAGEAYIFADVPIESDSLEARHLERARHEA